MSWMPILTAPRDSSPIWARGNNFGDPRNGQHYVWAYWDGYGWREARSTDDVQLDHLIEWLVQKS